MPVADVETSADVDEEKKTERPWKVTLYNDDVHSFDEVIFQLQKATGHSLERASVIVYEADRVGRAVCYEGTREDCNRVAAILRQIRLQVEVDRA